MLALSSTSTKTNQHISVSNKQNMKLLFSIHPTKSLHCTSVQMKEFGSVLIQSGLILLNNENDAQTSV